MPSPPFAATCTQLRLPPSWWPSSSLRLRAAPMRVALLLATKKVISVRPKRTLAVHEIRPTTKASAAPEALSEPFR